MIQGLKNRIFIGFVEENVDETRMGKIKVRVKSVFNEIPVEHIPWASPHRSLDGKSFSVPAIGKLVNVIFPDGELYSPEYIYSEKYNVNLQERLEELSDDEYTNFVALLYDHRSQISVDDDAMTFDYYENAIRIQDGKIDLKLKDARQFLNLGHSECDQDAVLGTNFFDWFDSFLDVLMQPTSLIGNYGQPIVKLQLEQKISEYNLLRPTFVSDYVKIVDNHKISADDYDNARIKKPALDDSTSENGEKILEPSNGSKNTKEEKAKEKLKEKVQENREKEVEKQVEKEADFEKIVRYRDEDDYDIEIVEEENKKDADKVQEILSGDPYGESFTPSTTKTITKVETDNDGNTTVTEKNVNKNDPYSSFDAVEMVHKSPSYGNYTVKNENVGDKVTNSGEVNTNNVESTQVYGSVSTSKIILPKELKDITNSKILTMELPKKGGVLSTPRDLKLPNGKIIKAEEKIKNMNEFIIDVWGPLAIFLKEKYPNLYKGMCFTSAIRGYVPKGGSTTSQHFYGQAIDFQMCVSGFKNRMDANLQLTNAILEWYNENPVGYDQFLFETRKRKSSWIHLSYKRNKNRLQFKRFVNDTSHIKGSYYAKINTIGKYVVAPIAKDTISMYI